MQAAKFLLVVVVVAVSCWTANGQDLSRRVLDKQWPAWPDASMIGGISDAAFNAANGLMYLAQRPSSASQSPVVVFESATGRYVTSLAQGLLVDPHGIKISPDGASFWVTDMTLSVVRQFDAASGALLTTIGTPGVNGTSLSPLQFSQPTDVAWSPRGQLWISDGNNGWVNRVVRYDVAAGKVVQVLGGVEPGSAPGQFNQPHSLTVDAQGRLYVADRQNGRVQIFADDGSYLTSWTDDGSCVGSYPEGLRFGAAVQQFVFDGLINGNGTNFRLLHVLAYDPTPGPPACLLVENIVNPPNGTDAHLCQMDNYGSVYCAELHVKPTSLCQKWIPLAHKKDRD